VSAPTFTFVPKQLDATGLAPGAAIVGAQGLTLYGNGFSAATQILVVGPVRITRQSQRSPVRPRGGRVAPSSRFPRRWATLSPDSKSITFGISSALSPGTYLVYASEPSAGLTSNGEYLEVLSIQAVAPAKTQTFSGSATALTSGQTITGQFLAGRDPSGVYSDVDYWYWPTWEERDSRPISKLRSMPAGCRSSRIPGDDAVRSTTWKLRIESSDAPRGARRRSGSGELSVRAAVA